MAAAGADTDPAAAAPAVSTCPHWFVAAPGFLASDFGPLCSVPRGSRCLTGARVSRVGDAVGLVGLDLGLGGVRFVDWIEGRGIRAVARGAVVWVLVWRIA